MAKKSGLFTLVTGMVAGAAAVFFSNEKNRDKAEKELTKAKATVKTFKKKFDDNPEATVDEIITKVEAAAKKQTKKIKNKVVANFQSAKTTHKTPKKKSKKA